MRIQKFHKIERKLSKSFNRIMGVDEVNVCSYFGEMVVAGVILPKTMPTWVCDSKFLNSTQIEKKAKILMKSVEYFIDTVSPRECDVSMLKYEYDSIKRLCAKATPDFVLIDYHSIPDKFHIPQWGVAGGDRILWSVAAASIIAKYVWNRKCKKYHKQYPEFDLIHNKGSFGSPLLELTKKYGITKHHRRRWLESTCMKKGIDITTFPKYKKK